MFQGTRVVLVCHMGDRSPHVLLQGFAAAMSKYDDDSDPRQAPILQALRCRMRQIARQVCLAASGTRCTHPLTCVRHLQFNALVVPSLPRISLDVLPGACASFTETFELIRSWRALKAPPRPVLQRDRAAPIGGPATMRQYAESVAKSTMAGDDSD